MKDISWCYESNFKEVQAFIETFHKFIKPEQITIHLSGNNDSILKKNMCIWYNTNNYIFYLMLISYFKVIIVISWIYRKRIKQWTS